MGGERGSQSFDDRISSEQHVRREGEAERTSGLEVDDQLELRRLLNRYVADFRALYKPVDQPGRLALQA